MFRKTKVYNIIIICMVIPILLAGCTKMNKHNEVVIGVAWPFKTNNDLFNEGIDLAVKEINSSGGIDGRKIRLLKRDDESEVTQGMSIAENFAENKEVQCVIGHHSSFVSIPASSIYDNAGLVMLSPTSTAPDLTSKGYKNVFRDIPSDDEIAKQLVIYLANHGHRRIVIYYSDDSYGTGLANSFESQAQLHGITVVDRFNCYTSIEDLKHFNARWQAYGIDGIFIAGSMPGGAEFIRDAGKAGINVPFFSGNDLDSSSLSKIGGKAAEGIIIGSVFNPNIKSLEVESFVKNFYTEYNEMPSSYAALGYDAVNMLAAAMRKSDLNNPSTIAKALKSLGKWSGAVGIHKFAENGDDIGDLVVLKKLHNGKFEYIKK